MIVYLTFVKIGTVYRTGGLYYSSETKTLRFRIRKDQYHFTFDGDVLIGDEGIVIRWSHTQQRRINNALKRYYYESIHVPGKPWCVLVGGAR